MSRKHRDSGPSDCKVYIGDLSSGATKEEIEDSFGYYGPLRNVWVARNPPGFAFVEFEDARDAEDAVRALDGKRIAGRRVRVEISTGRSRSRFRGPAPRRGRPFDPTDRCYRCGHKGHYAYDCERFTGKTAYRSRSRSRSRTPRRSRSRSRSRSYTRSRTHSRSRSRSYSRNRSRSRSGSRRSRSRSYSRSRSRSRSASRSPRRSRSHPRENGEADH